MATPEQEIKTTYFLTAESYNALLERIYTEIKRRKYYNTTNFVTNAINYIDKTKTVTSGGTATKANGQMIDTALTEIKDFQTVENLSLQVFKL